MPVCCGFDSMRKETVTSDKCRNHASVFRMSKKFKKFLQFLSDSPIRIWHKTDDVL